MRRGLRSSSARSRAPCLRSETDRRPQATCSYLRASLNGVRVGSCGSGAVRYLSGRVGWRWGMWCADRSGGWGGSGKGDWPLWNARADRAKHFCNFASELIVVGAGARATHTHHAGRTRPHKRHRSSAHVSQKRNKTPAPSHLSIFCTCYPYRISTVCRNLCARGTSHVLYPCPQHPLTRSSPRAGRRTTRRARGRRSSCAHRGGRRRASSPRQWARASSATRRGGAVSRAGRRA